MWPGPCGAPNSLLKKGSDPLRPFVFPMFQHGLQRVSPLFQQAPKMSFPSRPQNRLISCCLPIPQPLPRHRDVARPATVFPANDPIDVTCSHLAANSALDIAGFGLAPSFRSIGVERGREGIEWTFGLHFHGCVRPRRQVRRDGGI